MSYFALVLSDMRSSKIEHSNNLVAWSENQQSLLDLLERERVPGGYREDQVPGDQRWFKSFRKGGPLEWYNDWAWELEVIQPLETPDEVATRARARHQTMMDNVLRVE